MSAGAPDESAGVLRDRLHRLVLRELQTGGGLALGVAPGRSVAAEVRRIRELTALIATDRRGEHVRAAEALARRIQVRAVLDVGAGRAPWSLALARLVPAATVTAVDLPDVAGDLRRRLAADPADARFTVVAGDAFRDDLSRPGGYDVVLLANVCHLFPAASNAELVSRLAGYLAPGGVLAVIDQVLDDDPDWTLWAALYATGLPHTLPGGFLFTADEYATWLRDAGLDPEPLVALSAPPGLCLAGGRAAR